MDSLGSPSSQDKGSKFTFKLMPAGSAQKTICPLLCVCVWGGGGGIGIRFENYNLGMYNPRLILSNQVEEILVYKGC